MARMTKKQYEEMARKEFQELKEGGVSLEDRIKYYFDQYCLFGTATECKLSKMVRETGISREEIKESSVIRYLPGAYVTLK